MQCHEGEEPRIVHRVVPVNADTKYFAPRYFAPRYFAPSDAPFMVNYSVANVRAMIEQLRANGCALDDRIEETKQGVFGWVMDPEGNRVELWHAPKGQ